MHTSMNVHTWKNVKISFRYKSKNTKGKRHNFFCKKEQREGKKIGKNQQTYSSHECTCVTERRAHEILIFKKTHSFIEHHVQYILTHNRSHSHARTCSDYIVSISLLLLPFFLYVSTTPIWYYIKLNMVSCVLWKREWNVALKGFHITCLLFLQFNPCIFRLSQQLNLNVGSGNSVDEKSPEMDIING